MTNLPAIRNDFELQQRQAKALYASNYFSDAKSEAQAIVKVMAGAELGLQPFAAMTGIHIIKGKPVLGANLIATLVDVHLSMITLSRAIATLLALSLGPATGATLANPPLLSRKPRQQTCCTKTTGRITRQICSLPVH